MSNFNQTKSERSSERGGSIVEMMIVVSIFVLVATSMYRTLSTLTHLQVQSDSNVTLQIEGQKALNSIVTELRTAGFYRPLGDQTLLPYNTQLWVTQPANDPHAAWDVPYLWAGDGVANGVFGALSHTPANHGAKVGDEDYQATQEMAFVTIGAFITGSSAVTPTAAVSWTPSGLLGATANVVLPVQWQLVSYELSNENDNINDLNRIVRSVNPATMAIGPVISKTLLARHVEAVRFDTAQTDASLALYSAKITIWLRKLSPTGDLVQAKVQSRVKLRNSVQ